MPGNPEVQLEVAELTDLEAIQAMAEEIWRLVYPAIISTEQIDYMLQTMYDPATMRRDITRDSITYLMILITGVPRGFAAYGPGDAGREVFLHKLYLHPDFHGRGFGSRALHLIEERILAAGMARILRLRVNKRNAQAIGAYTRSGYSNAGSVCSDIGGGFVMDDFWMVKEL